jgi:hypothetical protein
MVFCSTRALLILAAAEACASSGPPAPPQAGTRSFETKSQSKLKRVSTSTLVSHLQVVVSLFDGVPALLLSLSVGLSPSVLVRQVCKRPFHMRVSKSTSFFLTCRALSSSSCRPSPVRVVVLRVVALSSLKQEPAVRRVSPQMSFCRCC